MTHPGQTVPLGRSLRFVTLLAALVLAVPGAQAYEVWLTDQSDTGKKRAEDSCTFTMAPSWQPIPLRPNRLRPSIFQARSASSVKWPRRKPSAAPTCSSSTPVRTMPLSRF